MPVTYDPVHPDVVIAAHAEVAPADGSEWWGGLLLALPSTAAAVAFGAWVLIGAARGPSSVTEPAQQSRW